ncbi:MAG TPA: aminopeptidase P N-terminal domain-containing protein [Pyrinomonadaceae bacterium]|jgi:Xaa-Pro aminopeptidase|nr:aminopeptidase P N-terminal domain-containing protein [Pyrinomonadaceae bacterium]
MKKGIIFFSIAVLAAVAIPAFGVEPLAPFVTPSSPQFSDAERQAELARRRAAVEAKMVDNSVLVMMSAEPKLYTNDVDYVFRQENNLYYVTALKQGGSTLVITKKGGVFTETLYLPKRNPRAETWTGHMFAADEAARISGIKDVVESSKRAAFLDGLKAKSDAAITTVYLLLPDSERDSDGMREFRQESDLSKALTGYTVTNAQPIFAELRQIKSPYELKMLQHAIDITTEAQERAWIGADKAKMEYEVQADVEYVFRKRNADYWGYPSIVGCGPNATTLHYEESQSPVVKGSLILMDVGAEYEHYSADVTRTFPVSGKFSREQAEIYQIVYDAQEAAAKVTKPGATMSQLSAAADDVIKDGLFRLGLITNKSSNQYRIWFMHGLGHWLGMNVHDVGSTSKLAPGMTYTNEPGIYIRADALDYLPDTPENKAFIEKVRPAFEKYKNIGVRIEDDMLITPTGVEWMTGKLPRKLSEVEAFIAANRK